MDRRSLHIITGWLFLFLLSLSTARAENRGSRQVTDMTGRTVTIPTEINRVFTDRFASLPVFALDATISCNYTFTINEVAGKFISPDYYTNKVFAESSIEEILKQHPDIIILGDMTGSNLNPDELQKKLKIPVIVITFSLEEYPETFRFLGDVLNLPDKSGQIVDFLKRYILPLQTATSALPVDKRPRVYYAEGLKGLNTEPSGSIHSQVLDYLHAVNVAKVQINGMHGMAPVSLEQIMQWNPDVVLVWSGMPSGIKIGTNQPAEGSTMDNILSSPHWKTINALKRKQVYQIPALPFGWFDRPPGSNCIAGVIWTAKTLYPELVPFDSGKALTEYFKLFYHTEITPSQLRQILSGE